MPRDWVATLNLISQAAALISILGLYANSISVPWDLRSWKGKTPWELRRRRRQILAAWIGVPCAFIAVGCQTALTLWPPG
jgi:hypothetical protein